MIVKFKKMDPAAVLPAYAHHDGEDNGLDLVAIGVRETEDFIEYNTGIAVEIPKGYTGLLVPNSRVSKMDLLMCNAPGIIDPGYRGAMLVRYKKVYHMPTLWERMSRCLAAVFANSFGIIAGFTQQNLSYDCKAYKVGDVVAQLVIVPAPQVEAVLTEELTPSARGEAGWGSTAKAEPSNYCPKCGALLSSCKDLDDNITRKCTNCGWFEIINNDGTVLAGTEKQ